MYEDVVFGCPATTIVLILETSTPVPNMDVVSSASGDVFGPVYGVLSRSRYAGISVAGFLEEISTSPSFGSGLLFASFRSSNFISAGMSCE